MSVSVFLLGIIAQSPRYPITDQLDREVAPHPPTLAIGVMSAPGDSSRRGYIRPSLRFGHAGLIFRFVLGLRGVSSTMVASTVAENATFGDLLGLSAARDGGRQFFAEKTLAWLRYAGRAFPLADFIGKVDQDTYFVWNRARRLLDLAVWQAGNRPLYIGQIEWTSFLPEERRVCGCCGYTREHAAYLQSQAGARFGSCGPQKSASTAISGPFPFAQGAFYALSRAALETGILRSSEADETQAVLASDRWRSGSEEDIMVGFLLSRSVPDLLILHWGLTIFHDFDRAGLFQNYYQIERACLDQHAILPSQLTTSEKSRWGTAETIGPMSAVHRVVDAQQWARADLLVAQWSRMLQHRGHPDCFYPNGTVTLAQPAVREGAAGGGRGGRGGEARRRRARDRTGPGS